MPLIYIVFFVIMVKLLPIEAISSFFQLLLSVDHIITVQPQPDRCKCCTLSKMAPLTLFIWSNFDVIVKFQLFSLQKIIKNGYCTQYLAKKQINISDFLQKTIKVKNLQLSFQAKMKQFIALPTILAFLALTHLKILFPQIPWYFLRVQHLWVPGR